MGDNTCTKLPIKNAFAIDCIQIPEGFEKQYYFAVPRSLDTEYIFKIFDGGTEIKSYSVSGGGITLDPVPNAYSTLGIVVNITNNDLAVGYYTFLLESANFTPDVQYRVNGRIEII